MTSTDGRWHPGIGDPSVMGWVTVAAYATAAGLCAYCASREVRAGGGKPAFWLTLALVMLALGINKQLDLQSWLTETGRDLAIAQGWYPGRRLVQQWFIAGLAFCGALTLGWMYRAFGDLGGAARLAMLGLVLLAVFVVVRAASFHHVDVMLGVKLIGMKINWILELGGIAIVVAGALAQLQVSRGRSRRS
jgi:hypothetical protein